MQPDVRHKPKEAFEFAANNGFTHVEILMDHPYYVLKNFSYAEVIELKWSYDLDLLIHAPATSTNFISLSDDMRKASYQEMRKVCYFADKCGAEVVTFHIGWNPGFINNGNFFFDRSLFDRHNEKVLMDELKPFVKSCPVQLALENTIMIEDGLERALNDILESTDMGLTIDVGHYNIQENPFFMENFDRVLNMHLHDNDGKQDQHLALGRGTVDLGKFRLDEYTGFLTIETREESAILESRNYLSKWGDV
nr:sugar phosphate isomerase/epimerase [Archaeoglobus neptunius]